MTCYWLIRYFSWTNIDRPQLKILTFELQVYQNERVLKRERL